MVIGLMVNKAPKCHCDALELFLTDIISCEFFKDSKGYVCKCKVQKTFIRRKKLTYALLYDRLSLSKINGWINEVFLIYTREAVAEDLGISYKKAISAFKELTEAQLITEQRCGRGIPNKIYIVTPELDEEQAKEYMHHENSRTAKMACLENNDEIKTCRNGTLIILI